MWAVGRLSLLSRGRALVSAASLTQTPLVSVVTALTEAASAAEVGIKAETSADLPSPRGGQHVRLELSAPSVPVSPEPFPKAPANTTSAISTPSKVPALASPPPPKLVKPSKQGFLGRIVNRVKRLFRSFFS